MSSKKIMIRADGNAMIGAGHIMRCLSVAAAAKELGAECLFVTADSSFSETIKRYEISQIVLESDYSDLKRELEVFSRVIDENHPAVLLIDSYHVTEHYLLSLRDHVKTAYIDDFKKDIYPVDYLINYTPDATYSDYAHLYENVIQPPVFLLGEAYTPLRKEFQNLEEQPIRKIVKDVLFSAGGADPERIALRFIKRLLSCSDLMDIRFHLVLGNYEPDIDEILSLCIEYPNLIPHRNVTHMADLMRQCDAAVSAAGSTLYELSACGIPTITYILEDNQIAGALAFESKGIMINAGDVRGNQLFFDDLINTLRAVCSNYDLRSGMHFKAVRIVDGRGAARVAQTLLQ